MSKNTSVILGEHFESFVQNQVQGGRYGSASEVIRAGLRLLEDNESRREQLQRLLQEGIESGISDRTSEDIMNDVLKRRGLNDAI
ncbi:MAG: type II toxin-antitoxin system ParD family antitoxin [Pseudomonadota bacterium]